MFMRKSIDIKLLLIIIGFTFILLIFPFNFKFAVASFMLFLIVLYAYVKNMFLAAFIVTIISLQFYVPNKSYMVPTLRYQSVRVGYKIDYVQSYGLTLTNIFVLVTLYTYVRHSKTTPLSKMGKISLGSGIIFTLLTLINSKNNSPFPELSQVWTIQYFQLYLIAIFTFVALKFHKNGKKQFLTALVATLIFQSCLGYLQFIKQSPIGSSIENSYRTYFASGIDENNALHRITGTFSYDNQFAIISLSLLLLLTSALTQQSILFLLLMWIQTGVSIILSQSRSVMIAFGMAMLFIYLTNKRLIKNYVYPYYSRLLVYSLLLLALLSPIIIPRMLLATNIFHKDGSVSLRMKMIAESIVLIRERPFLGYGPGTNEYLLFHNAPEFVNRDQPINLNQIGSMVGFTASVHNGFVSMILETGIVGFIIFCFPLIMLVRKSIIKKQGFIYLIGINSWIIYYLLQPHAGIIEFSYIGLLLGYGLSTET